MSTATTAPASAVPKMQTRAAAAAFRPGFCFWLVGTLLFGGIALNFAGGHLLDQTSRDLWQHLASLRALIADPANPGNPFIVGTEGSRHYHPYWVALASLARLLGWNEWQAIVAAGFVSAGVILSGIWVFARAFYRDAWGPLALLAAMVLGWTLPVSHTGFHSVETLIEGIAYPAALLVGLSMLLWGLTIHALERPRLAVLIVPLVAFMTATHQLGAGIGLIAAGCFALFSPGAPPKVRAACLAAMVAGVALSLLWPYHNPFDAVARTGNPTWTGGPNFYGPRMMITAGIPSLIGLAGLLHPEIRRRALPALVAFLLFAALFALGAFGFLVATRFLPAAVLMLHVGLGALFLIAARCWSDLPKARQLAAFGFALLVVQFHLLGSWVYLGDEFKQARKIGNVHDAALALTRDIPDGRPVAVFDVAVWPVVATGQKAVSVPWPEPMISDLAKRQQAVERLFDAELPADRRRVLARSWGATTLIMDRRGALRRETSPKLLRRLEAQAVRRIEAGPFVRFDLE